MTNRYQITIIAETAFYMTVEAESEAKARAKAEEIWEGSSEECEEEWLGRVRTHCQIIKDLTP